jgi:hypothetical protein
MHTRRHWRTALAPLILTYMSVIQVKPFQAAVLSGPEGGAEVRVGIRGRLQNLDDVVSVLLADVAGPQGGSHRLGQMRATLGSGWKAMKLVAMRPIQIALALYAAGGYTANIAPQM